MEKDIYFNIENEIKKCKYFGRNNLALDISMIVTFIIIIILSFFIFINQECILITISIVTLLYISCIFLSPGCVVYRYFRDDTRRRTIQQRVSKNSNKFIAKLDFSKPLKFGNIFRVFKMMDLQVLIRKTCPTILEIIEKYGISTNKQLKEVIDHYRFIVATTKEKNIKLLPILTIIIPIALAFIQDAFSIKIIFTVLLILVVLLFIAIKFFFSYFYNQYSQITFYKNMELALSEILISNILDEDVQEKQEAQFGFKSHLL